jgi:biotin carboxylase
MGDSSSYILPLDNADLCGVASQHMPRVLLLLPTTTYRTRAFIEAARRAGIDVTVAADETGTLQEKNPATMMTLDFLDPVSAAKAVVEFAAEHPIDAVIPVDEDTALAASFITGALGLRGNPFHAAQAAKHKRIMRETLRRAEVRVPRFRHFTLDDDIEEIARSLSYPCVVKPVFLSTSRGVMRADDPVEFATAVYRLESILKLKDVERRGAEAAREVLVEEFIPGREVALEGLVTGGRLTTLAIFDKPDPLDGPFFEETIYVTPSRLSQDAQHEIIETTQAAITAMELGHGPVHAELRVNESGAWVIEVAARAIGGLCSRALSFKGGASLEEVILRHALGEDVSALAREGQSSGVMMIPIPRAGTLKEVRGMEEARSVPQVEDIIISAHITKKVAPPPEGSSYLGFIFSRAETPEAVESALRLSHSLLEFVIE